MGIKEAGLHVFDAAIALAQDGGKDTYAGQTSTAYANMVGPFGGAISATLLNAIMSQQVPANAQGELQGAVASLYSLASVVGPPLMTHLFGRFSAPDSHIQFPGAAFLCAALLVATSGALFLAAIRRSAAVPVMAEQKAPAPGH